MRNPTVFSAMLLLVLATAQADEPPELARIERQIKRQPAYTAEKPLYGLYVFGPKAETRVWAVLDKSAAENDQYDVLYFDRDADGDLTEDERIIGKIDEPGNGVSFSIGDFTDPRNKAVHTSLTLTRRPSGDGSVMLKLNWQGHDVVRGGYAEDPGPYAQFASSIAEAPILWDQTGLNSRLGRACWLGAATNCGSAGPPTVRREYHVRLSWSPSR